MRSAYWVASLRRRSWAACHCSGRWRRRAKMAISWRASCRYCSRVASRERAVGGEGRPCHRRPVPSGRLAQPAEPPL